MAHQILLVVEKPKEPSRQLLYGNAIGNLSEIAQKNKGVQALGENVLLLHIEGSLNILSEVVKQVGGHQYKYAIFDEKIEWHEGPKKV